MRGRMLDPPLGATEFFGAGAKVSSDGCVGFSTSNSAELIPDGLSGLVSHKNSNDVDVSPSEIAVPVLHEEITPVEVRSRDLLDGEMSLACSLGSSPLGAESSEALQQRLAIVVSDSLAEVFGQLATVFTTCFRLRR